MADQVYTIEFREDGSALVIGRINDIGKVSQRADKRVKTLQKTLKNFKTTTTAVSSATTSLVKFNSGVSKSAKEMQKVGGSASALATDWAALGRAMRDNFTAGQRFVTIYNKVDAGLRKVAKGSIRQLGKELSFVTGKMKRFAGQLNIVAKLAGTLGAIFGARAIIRYADSWTGLNNKLKIVTKSERELIAVRTELLNISRRTRSDLSGATTLYQRLRLANKTLAKSQKEVLQFTESVGQALAISGATGEETRSVLIQLAQGLGSVAVRGDEFRSVMEASPRLVQALGDATGYTVGQLKELTSQGKFTSKQFFEALMTQSEALRRDFAKTSSTFAQVGTVFKNVFKELVGEVGDKTGVFSAIATSLLDVADSLRANINQIVAGILLAKESLAGIVKDQGFSGLFVKTAQLAGETFIKLLIAGLKTLKSIVVGLGRLLVQTIVDDLATNYPKLAKKLGIGQPLTITQKIEKLDTKDLKSLTVGISDQAIIDASGAIGILGKESKKAFADAVRESESLKTVIYGLATAGEITADQLNDAIAGIDSGSFADDMIRVGMETQAALKGIGAEFLNAGLAGEDAIVVYQRILDDLNKIKDESTIGIVLPDMAGNAEETVGVFGSLMADGKDFFQGIGAGFEKLSEDAMTFGEIMSTSVAEGVRGVSDELASLIVTGKADFKQMAGSIIQDMISMMIQAQITGAMMSLFGEDGFFPAVGSALGIGGNQFGGLVSEGVPTMVGERGPELFVPPTAGKIMTNSQSKGGEGEQSIRIVNNVTGDAVLQSSTNSVIDKVVLNSFSRNSTAMRGMLA